jgi:hypothetical protein
VPGLALAAILLAVACTPSKSHNPSPSKKSKKGQRAAAETLTVRDPEAEQRAVRLQMRVLEREAQLADLQARLDDARQEVVRAMAKLQSLASRAEAASGMAEAEIALDSLKVVGQQAAPYITQVTKLLHQSSAEFDNQNYGGALYLANQAKSVAAAGRRLSLSDIGTPRPGEVAFALPLPLQTVGRGNIRAGPGTGFKVLFTVDAGTPLVAYSFVDVWVRVSLENDRSGWIAANLIGKRQD